MNDLLVGLSADEALRLAQLSQLTVTSIVHYICGLMTLTECSAVAAGTKDGHDDLHPANWKGDRKTVRG